MIDGRQFHRRLQQMGITGALLAIVLGVPLATSSFAEIEDISDTDIIMAIHSGLIVDRGVPAHWIDVSSTDGVVTLEGSVDNLLARERAVKRAKAIKGVRSVVNRIHVKSSGLTAKEVENAVKQALLMDPATDSYEIDVEADSQGRVTLSGEVDSWAEEQLCLDVAKGVRGVREVVNEIDVAFRMERPDSEIRAEVLRRMQNDVWVNDGTIDVAVEDAHVTLTGSVGSAAERSRALRDAWVNGVRQVDVDDLEVKWWLEDEMRREHRLPDKSDAAVESAVKDALLYDPRVLSFNPSVSVSGGVVTLTGVVSDLTAKRAATEAAWNTVGVRRVKNYLRVRPDVTVGSALLAKRVREALERNPFTERQEIAVHVINGEAVLRGRVDSEFERSEAVRVASSVLGVVSVEEHLRVMEPWIHRSDRDIKEDIESELWWSPYVDSDEIDVRVVDGVATLDGTVDSWGEWRAAEDNAYEGGARRVRNLLLVRYSPVTSSSR